MRQGGRITPRELLCRKHGSPYATGALVASVIVGCGLRFALLGQQSFWYDESVTAQLGAAPLHDLLTGVAEDFTNARGFWILAHAWQTFARSDAALRVLPALLGVIGVIATFAAVRAIVDTRTGVLTAALLAINPEHVYLSQEYRAYTAMLVCCAAVLGAAWTFLRSGSRAALLLYVLAGAAGLYTQYYVGLTLVAVNIWALLHLRGRRPWILWLVAQFSILLIFGVALPQLLEHATMRLLTSDGSASRLHLIVTPLTLLFGRTLVWSGAARSEWLLAGSASLLVWVVAAIGISRRGVRGASAYLVICAVAPYALAVLMVLVTQMQAWDDRKALAMLVPALGLLAIGLDGAPRRSAAAATILLVLGSALALLHYYSAPYKDDWRDVEAYILARASAGDAVLVVPDHEAVSLLHYAERPGGLESIGVAVFGYDVQRAQYVENKGSVHQTWQSLPSRLAQAQHVWHVCDARQVPACAHPASDAAAAATTHFARGLEVALSARPGCGGECAEETRR
jgi:uncharacterized membrane protein